MTPQSVSVAAFGILADSRGLGLVQFLQDRVPSWTIEAFAAATHLGDTAVLLVLASLVYLVYDRQDGAFVLGALLAGFALVVATKAWFGLARPPSAVQYVPETGYGFPSGHAVGAAVGWGAMAIVLEEFSTRRRRVAVAAFVIITVALSRVVIGVHYLVDVAVGIAVGLAVLGGSARWARRSPVTLFGAAGGLAAIAVVAASGSFASVALLGACLGAVTAWQLIEPADRPYGRNGFLGAIGGGLVVGGVGAIVAPVAAIAFAGAVAITAGVMLLPVARSAWLGSTT